MSEKEKPGRTPSSDDRGEQFIAWVNANRGLVVAAAAAVVLVGGGIWFVREYRTRTEVAAQTALDAARISVQAENYPLAASDLTRLIESYKGTPASQEAVLILGQVRLLQGQPGVAAQELQAALPSLSDEFRAAGLGLLGTAWEDAGNPVEASTAYERASQAAPYPFLTAQYLVDAARAAVAAGDTAKAIRLYETVVRDHGEAPARTEARVRLGELRTGIRS